MAFDLSHLSPDEQNVLQTLFKKAASENPATPAVAGANGVEAASQMPLQQQEGDAMHPADAISKIGEVMFGPKAPSGVSSATGPQLTQDDNGQLQTRVPVDQPLLGLFGMKKNVPINEPNYFSTAQQSGLVDYLPKGLAQLPDGTPFVGKTTLEAAKQAQRTGVQNVPVTKAEALGLGMSQAQADQLFGDDPKKTLPLNMLNLGPKITMAETRKGALGLATDKTEADLIGKFVKGISEAAQSGRGVFGVAAQKVQNAALARQTLASRYDPQTDTYQMSPTEFADFNVAAAKALNSTGQLSDHQINLITQSSLRGDVGKVGTYLFGTPFQGSTQDLIRRAVNLVDKEGLTAQQASYQYAKQGLPLGIVLQKKNPAAYRQAVQDSFGGIDYQALLDSSPDTKSPNYLAPHMTPLDKTNAPGVQPGPNNRTTVGVSQPSAAKPDDGFTTPEGIKAAYKAGKLSREQARALVQALHKSGSK